MARSFVFVAGQDHALSKKPHDILQYQDIAVYPAVLPKQETGMYQLIAQRFEQYKLTLNVQNYCNHLLTIEMLVKTGFGWSVLPENMLDESVQVLPVERSLYRNLGMVMHTQRSLSNAALRFCQQVSTQN